MALTLALGWATSSYLFFVRGRRFDVATEIENAEPDPFGGDAAESAMAEDIHAKLWGLEFPFLGKMAFHLALLRTYTIANISRAVAKAGGRDPVIEDLGLNLPPPPTPPPSSTNSNTSSSPSSASASPSSSPSTPPSRQIEPVMGPHGRNSPPPMSSSFASSSSSTAKAQSESSSSLPYSSTSSSSQARMHSSEYGYGQGHGQGNQTNESFRTRRGTSSSFNSSSLGRTSNFNEIGGYTGHSHRSVLTSQEQVYVIAVLAVEPCKLVDRYGYRRLSQKEKEATCRVWRDLGIRMGIVNIPDSYRQMEEYAEEFERTHASPHPTSPTLAQTNIDHLIHLLPLPRLLLPHILPFARSLAIALIDPSVRETLRLPPPHPFATTVCHLVLSLHSVIVRYLLLPRVDMEGSSVSSSGTLEDVGSEMIEDSSGDSGDSWKVEAQPGMAPLVEARRGLRNRGGGGNNGHQQQQGFVMDPQIQQQQQQQRFGRENRSRSSGGGGRILDREFFEPPVRGVPQSVLESSGRMSGVVGRHSLGSLGSDNGGQGQASGDGANVGPQRTRRSGGSSSSGGAGGTSNNAVATLPSRHFSLQIHRPLLSSVSRTLGSLGGAGPSSSQTPSSTLSPVSGSVSNAGVASGSGNVFVGGPQFGGGLGGLVVRSKRSLVGGTGVTLAAESAGSAGNRRHATWEPASGGAAAAAAGLAGLANREPSSSDSIKANETGDTGSESSEGEQDPLRVRRSKSHGVMDASRSLLRMSGLYSNPWRSAPQSGGQSPVAGTESGVGEVVRAASFDESIGVSTAERRGLMGSPSSSGSSSPSQKQSRVVFKRYSMGWEGGDSPSFVGAGVGVGTGNRAGGSKVGIGGLGITSAGGEVVGGASAAEGETGSLGSSGVGGSERRKRLF
ncbi:hypothetical protein HDU76_000749 [Blyttiomyces sp. JEL0837]|nr:hypothetical protein HDU76_000749 [Blyttiomyces sp. JEL0837]